MNNISSSSLKKIMNQDENNLFEEKRGFKKRNFEEFFEENIIEKTVVINDEYRRDKEMLERTTRKSDILNNPLILAETYKNYILDKDRYSADKKDVFALNHWIYEEKEERLILEDIFQMMLSQENETFGLKKDDKFEYSIFYIKNKYQLSHLTPLALENVLEEYVRMANSLQEINYLINDLQNIFKGNIFEGFLNSISKIKNHFYEDVCNLQLIFLYHSHKCKHNIIIYS